MTGRVHGAASHGSGPWAALFGRYGAVAAVAWRQRHQMAATRRSADELAFLPAALSLQETPAHPAPRRLAWLLMVLFALVLAWAWIGTVDIVAVAAGRIVVDDRNKLIQPLERSVVHRVLVRDGDHVVPGQPLVELDATSVRADKTSVLQQMRAAYSERLRARLLLQALQAPRYPEKAPGQPQAFSHPLGVPGEAGAGGRYEKTPGRSQVFSHPLGGPGEAGAGGKHAPKVSLSDLRDAADGLDAAEVGALSLERHTIERLLSDEWNDIVARQARLLAELHRREAEIATAQAMVDKLSATLPLIRQREDDLRALAAQGFVSSHAGQDRMRERVEMERDLLAQRARLQEAVAAQAENLSGQAALIAETRHKLSERQTQAELRWQQARQELAKASQREQRAVLRAPIAGVVQELAVHTVGGVVTEAQTLMVIVPEASREGPVVAEVVLENKDIGFVHVGQMAEVKLETFLFTRYGTVPATVQRVTADAVNDERRGAIFPARLVLASNAIDVDGRRVRVGPGMNVTAEIKTGQRRVIEFLLSPLQRAGSESLRER